MRFNINKKITRTILTISFAMVFLGAIFFAIKASANQTVFKLTGVSITEKSNDVIASVDDFDSDDIKLDAEFHRINDYVTYKLIIKNTSSHDYTLKTISDNNTNSYITYEYEKHENEVVKAGDSLELVLKAIYKNEQTDIENRNQIENFKLLFSFVNEDGVPVDGNIDINPKTGDTVVLYYIIAGASLIGIAIINIKFKNNKIRNILITLVVLTPFVAKAAESSFSVLIKGETKLLDKLVVKYNDGEEITKVVNYGDTITEPAAPSKNGYTFDGWYLNNELYDFSKPVTKDGNLVPKYTADPTTYTVKHKYENIDGTYEETVKTIDAVTDEEVTAPIISKTGFNDPTAQSVKVSYDGSTSVEYIYTRKEFSVIFNTNGGTSVSSVTRKYDEAIGTLPETTKNNYILDGWYTQNDGGSKVQSTDKITSKTNYYARWNKSIYFAEIFNTNIELTRGDNSQIVITNITQIAEEISYISSDENVVTVDNDGNITATGKGSTTITLEGNTSHITKTVNVTVSNEGVKVHFNTHGGTNVSDVNVENETKIGSKLPNGPTNEHYIFDAWYTTDSYETKVTGDTVVNGETTYHAKWLDTVYNANIVNSNIELIRNNGEQINISNIATIGENITYTSSDETVATVTSDGYVNALKKGTATITVKGTTSNTTKDVSVTVFNEQINVSFDSHDGSIVDSISMEAGTKIGNKLPSTNPTRDNYIFDAWYTTESYTTKVTSDTVIDESTTLHAKWGKSIYFANITNQTINLTRHDQANINIDNLDEIKESITYSSSDEGIASVDSDGRITANGKGTATITLTGSISKNTKTVTVNVNNENVLVHFDSHGGTSVSDIEIENETAIGDNIPTGTTKEHFIFDAWYTTDSYTTKVTSSTVVDGETTYHAKWNNSLYQADLENDEYNIIRNEDKQIVISNISSIGESISYSSNNEDVATVSSSGKITAHAKGAAIITLTGNTSHETKIVTVNVTNEMVTIHFDSHGGTSISDIEIENETKIGENLPSNITKYHYLFDGWYTTDSYETKVTSDTVVNGSTTYHAKWNKTVYDLDIQNDDITLPNQGTGSIIINNASEIGETFTFSSDFPDLVAVDSEGNLTALAIPDFLVKVRITGDISGEIRTVGVRVVPRKYTVSFNTHASSTISSIEVDEGGTLSSIPTPTNGSNTFVGWFYNEDGTGNMLTTSTIINESHEYHAKWTGVICKKATTLNTEVCNSPSGKGCRANGKSVGDIITYGNYINSDTYLPGDAFDCDVDGTGYNQRFYYVTNNGDNAVLISHTTFSGESAQSNINVYYNYDTSLTLLPTTTQWSNLPVKFEIQSGDFRPARMIKLEELEDMTGLNYSQLKGDNALNNYEFLFENSLYSGVGERSTAWLEQTVINNKDTRIRYRNDTRKLDEVSSDKYNTSNNCIKPVIEVPFDQIEDSYLLKFIFGNDPSSSNYVYQNVTKGTKIGTLPSYSDTSYAVVGWYKDTNLTNEISENTIPQGYETYYSLFKLKADHALFATTDYKLSNNTTSTIVILNSDDVEPLTYTSNNESIATVDSEGIITAHGVGTTTIVIEGSYSHTSQTVDVTVTENTPKVTVSFDTHGGSPVDDIVIDINTSIGTMPTTTKDGYTFLGWFNNESYDVEIKGDNEILADVTLHAKWRSNSSVCEMNNEYYDSIQEAINDAPTSKTTIKLLSNVQITTPIDMFNNNTNKDIILDLNGYTLSPASSAAAKTNIIKTKGKLLVKNGTINSNKNDAVIHVEGSSSLLTLKDDIRIVATGERAAIYNNGGTVLIEDGSYLSANAEFSSSMKRGTIQTLGGTTTITGGTIVSTTQGTKKGFAVAASAGTVTIGTKDGVASQTTPVLIGETYGVRVESGVNIYFYDGIIKAITAVFENTVIPNNNIEEGYETKTGIIDEAGKIYNTFYLSPLYDDYKVQFNVGGGTVDPLFINVTPGESVDLSDLPVPSKGVYTFDGWYLDENAETTPVTYPFTPDSDTIFYARWIYDSSDEIVNFDMISDAMRVYYNNISGWKDLDKSTFQSNMLANFTAKTCSKCNGDNSCTAPLAGNLCEQTKGYDTGVSDEVLVYESSEANKEKGNLVSYTTSSDGVIYNMIPGKVYYWESSQDSQIHGYVKAQGERRTIKSSVRNVRDLGGMATSFTRNNTTKTGTLKYGKLFRGAQLSGGQNDVDSILKLGVTREIDLRVQTEGSNPVRLPKHDKCDSNCSTLTSDQDIIIENYLIYPDNQYPDLSNPGTYKTCPVIDGRNCSDNFINLRQAMIDVMNYVINGDSLYFHCTIGTDRTGTIAYFLEGLLGVSEEDRVEDYELTYFYGMTNRDRYHDYLSGSSRNPRFTTMYKTYDTNEKIYDWFMYGLSAEEKAEMDALIEDFRDAMIDYN